MPRYSSLNAHAVRATVTRLENRIRARFPHRHLPEVAAEVGAVVDEILHARPSKRYELMLVASRTLIVILVLGLLIALGVLLAGTAGGEEAPESWEWVALLESSVNDLVFVSIAVFFLWHAPARVQRTEYLESLHKLRSLAHTIDMHQLTKDPERLTLGFRKTSESIDLDMDVHQLHQYLDYCSEMLSLVGKAAALFAERSRDDVVLSTVEAIEDLTSALSQKIWQKISLIRLRDDIPS